MLFVEILGGVSGADGCGSETVIMLCKKWHLVPVFFFTVISTGRLLLQNSKF